MPKRTLRGRAPWREGNSAVILVTGAIFPRRCVICNARATNRLARALHWHSRWIYPLLCAGLLPYFVASAIASRTAVFEIYLCDYHLRRRTLGQWVGYLGVPSCLLGMILLLPPETRAQRYLASFFALIMVVTAFAALWLVRSVSARRITADCAWLRVGKPFLDSLPTASELSEPRA